MARGNTVRPFLKALGFLAVTLTVMALGTLAGLFPKKMRRRLRTWFGYVGSRALTLVLAIQGHWRQDSLTPSSIDLATRPTSGPGRLFVSNHMSYLDVVVLLSFHPFVFVTSRDVQKQFFLGQVAWGGGSLFVDRKNMRALVRDLKQVEEALRQGFDVFVFPEATSSNGEGLLPFRRGLFQAAVRTGATTIPVRFRYPFIDGEPLARHNRDRVCYYGDMTFASHILGVLATHQLEAEALELSPLPPSLGAEGLAEASRQSISQALVPLA